MHMQYLEISICQTLYNLYYTIFLTAPATISLDSVLNLIQSTLFPILIDPINSAALYILHCYLNVQ